MSENEAPGGSPPPSDPPAPPPAEPTPPPPPGEPAPQPPAGGEGDNRTLMLALSYLWLLALVPLLVEKDDAEVQWHAKHGLVLMVAEIILLVVIGIPLNILGAIVGCSLGCFLVALLSLAIAALHVVCIVKAVGGERFLIPYLSPFADRF